MNKKYKIILVYPQKNTLLFAIPLGIAYIGAVLRESGREIKIIDMRYDDEKKLYLSIQDFIPDVIGFYSSSEIAPYVSSLGKKIKDSFKNIKIIAGGPHATIDPAFFIDRGFDAVVMGEGEKTVTELISAYENNESLEKIKGISFKKNSSVLINPQREFIENLDDLPFPAFDLFEHVNETFEKTLSWPNIKPFTHIILSRGCPYQCSFCQPTLSTMFGKKVRRVSPQRAIDMLLCLKERFGVKEVFFEDDLLLSRIWKDWLFELTDLMISKKLDIRWWGQARANSADKDILERAKKAGCYMVMCGVESGCKRTLDFYNKEIAPQDVRNFFNMCRELKLLSIAEIIFGAPLETMEDALETIRLVRELKPDMTWVSILTPYPGTHLVKWLDTNNINYEKDLKNLDRSRQVRKIDSVMNENQLYEARSRITQNKVLLKNILTKDFYRRIFFEKLSNFSINREYGELFKFLIWSMLSPLTNSMQLFYIKNSKNPIIKSMKKVFNNLNS